MTAFNIIAPNFFLQRKTSGQVIVSTFSKSCRRLFLRLRHSQVWTSATSATVPQAMERRSSRRLRPAQ
jgi:hypothetical protein